MMKSAVGRAKRNARNPKRNQEITLSCEFSSAPGYSWFSLVQFRPLKKGFSVWATDTETPQTLRHLDVLRSDLTWRSAARWLQENVDKVGLFGEDDLASTMYVSGVAPVESDILKLCWLNPAYAEGYNAREFLLSLSDTDLAYLHRAEGSLVSQNACYFFGELKEAIDGMNLEGQDLKAVARHVGWKRLPPPDKLLERLNDRWQWLEKREANEMAIKCAVEEFTRREFKSTQGTASTYRATLVHEFLLHFLTENKDLPGGVIDIPGVGTVDIDALFGRLNGFVRDQPDGLLSVEVLEKAARLGEPQPGQIQRRLIASWLAAAPKPCGPAFSQAHGGLKQFAFVLWLFGWNIEGSVQDLAAHHPQGLRILMAWLDEEKDRILATKGAGGAHGAAVYGQAKNIVSQFVDRFKQATNAVLSGGEEIYPPNTAKSAPSLP